MGLYLYSIGLFVPYAPLLARDNIGPNTRYMLSPVRFSTRLSVTRVDQSKMVEVRIMQLSPQVAP